MRSDDLSDGLAYPEYRIERGHRVLEDHGDARAPKLLHLVKRQVEQRHIVEGYLSGSDSTRGKKPQYGARRKAFAGSAFTDQAQGLSRTDLKGQFVHDL